MSTHDEILAARLAELRARVEPVSQYCTTPAPSETLRYVLTEWTDTGAPMSWVSLHASPAEAATYHHTQEQPHLWRRETPVIIDLCTAQQWEVEPPRPPVRPCGRTRPFADMTPDDDRTEEAP